MGVLGGSNLDDIYCEKVCTFWTHIINDPATVLAKLKPILNEPFLTRALLCHFINIILKKWHTNTMAGNVIYITRQELLLEASTEQKYKIFLQFIVYYWVIIFIKVAWSYPKSNFT